MASERGLDLFEGEGEDLFAVARAGDPTVSKAEGSADIGAGGDVREVGGLDLFAGEDSDGPNQLDDAGAEARREPSIRATVGPVGAAGLAIRGGAKKALAQVPEVVSFSRRAPGPLGTMGRLVHSAGNLAARALGREPIEDPGAIVGDRLRESGEADIDAAQEGRGKVGRAALRGVALGTEFADVVVPIAGGATKLVRMGSRLRHSDSVVDGFLKAYARNEPAPSKGAVEQVRDSTVDVQKRWFNSLAPVTARTKAKSVGAKTAKEFEIARQSHRVAVDLGRNPVYNFTHTIRDRAPTGEPLVAILEDVRKVADQIETPAWRVEEDLRAYIMALAEKDLKRSLKRRKGVAKPSRRTAPLATSAKFGKVKPGYWVKDSKTGSVGRALSESAGGVKVRFVEPNTGATRIQTFARTKVTAVGRRETGLRRGRVAEQRLVPVKSSTELPKFVQQRPVRKSVTPSGKPLRVESKSLRDANDVVVHLRGKYGSAPRRDRRFGGVAGLDDLAERYDIWSDKAFLQPLEEVGVISAKEAQRIRSTRRFFGPYERALDELAKTGEDLTFAAPLKGGVPVKGRFLTGGLSSDAGRRVEDVFDESIDRAYRIGVFTHRQQLKNMVLDAAEANPGSRLADEVKRTDAPAFTSGTFQVYRNGKAITVKAPKEMVEAMDGLEVRDMGLALNIAAKVTEGLRAGLTLSPRFGFRNFQRDPLEAFVKSRNGQLPVLGPARALFDIVSETAGRGRGAYDSLWSQFVASGAPGAAMNDLRRGTMAKEVAALRKMARTGKAGRAARNLADPLYALKLVSNFSERPSRIAEFSAAIRAGKTPAQAGLDASEVPMNFSRAGELGKVAKAFEIFINPMLQDPGSFFRAMRDGKAASVITKTIAAFTIPSLAFYFKNRDDPDWRELPEWQKFVGMQVAKNPDTGRFYNVYFPPGAMTLMFHYLPMKALEELSGRDPEGFEKFARQFVQETPLKYTPATIAVAENERERFDFAIDASPTLFQPFVELAANRSPFLDGPAISPRLLRRAPAERLTEFTSSPALDIGRTAAGEAVGGPAGVDYLIQSYLGSLGRDIASGIGGQQTPLIDRGVPEGLRGVPVARELAKAFTSSSPVGFGTQSVRRFYSLVEIAEQKSASLKTFETREQQQRYVRNNPELRYVKHMRKVREALGDYAEMRRRIIEQVKSGKLSDHEADDQLYRIDSQVTLLSSTTLQQLEARIEADMRADFDEDVEKGNIGGETN